ncbi:helix-turn-helix domain-containing protein [Cupriavidus necator]
MPLVVQKFDRWVWEPLDSPLTLDAAAQALATSKRTLSRRLHQVLGETPFAYIQDLRIKQAVHLLKTTRLSVERIAEQVVMWTGVSL